MHMIEEPARPTLSRADVPAQLEYVILKCLAKDPDQRFASMLEFAEALEQSGLATTEPDTPSYDVRRSGPQVTPMLASGVGRDQRRTAQRRKSALQHAHAGAWLQVALWGLVLSLVALRVPEQPMPMPHLQTGIDASLATPLPAAVVVPAALVEKIEIETGIQAPTPAPAELVKVARPRALASALEKSARRAAAGAAPLQPVAVSSTPPIAAHPPSPETHAAVVEDLALQPGFLSLDSAPWSEVFLGASALGTTPLIRVPLPPGRHQLTLRNSELGASTTYVVEIKSGQSLARLVGWGR